MTDDGKINNIDLLINLFNNVTELSENEIEKVIKSETLGLIATSKSLGIILQKSDGKYIPGPTYYEIKRHGTFKKYHEYEINKLELSKKLLESSIKTNDRTIWILSFTIIVSLFSAGVTWLNYDLTRKHQEPSRRKIDSLSNILIEKQIHALQDLKETLKADSLDND